MLAFAAVATGAIACNSTLDLARPVDPPSDWWDCAFGHRRAITATLSTGGNLADFPVAVRLDPARIDYTATQVSGGDLRFVIGSGASAVVLDHEIETWSPGAESVIWVRVPSLAPPPGSTVFRLCYGNAAATDVQDPPGVWDASFQGVWHLTTTTGQTPDSTSHANHGTLAGAIATSGAMGPALAFDGDDAVRITAPSFHDSFGSFTVSLWARADSLPEKDAAPAFARTRIPS